jgi:hypothetical protein
MTHAIYEIWNCERGRGKFVIFSGYLVGIILGGGIFTAKENRVIAK